MSDGVRLTFRGGGWVIVVAALLVAALVLWAFAGVLSGHRRLGGSDLASYGFDLSTCLVPREGLTPTGQPRDFLATLRVERTMAGSAMTAFNEQNRKRYVVSDDRVVGVRIGGEARAYPLYLLNGHEIIEDTLGGVPIAVTYSPLCDAVGVYERRVDGVELRLHLSGLVQNANGLAYDESPVPSLWRQLDGKAIAGPWAAKGAALRRVPGVALTTWSDWLAAHPDTTVPERDPGNVRLYESISYVREHESSAIPFPVSPAPQGSMPWKSTILVLRDRNASGTWAIDRLRAAATDGVATVDLGGRPLRIHVPATEEPTWRVEDDAGDPVEAWSSFWFAASSILSIDEPRPGI